MKEAPRGTCTDFPADRVGVTPADCCVIRREGPVSLPPLGKVDANVSEQTEEVLFDFYCSSAKMVIEVDGSQHYVGDSPERDSARNAYLESLGLRVIRIDNQEIKRNFDKVCMYLWKEMGL